jgi:uncharacterized Zn finger protein
MEGNRIQAGGRATLAIDSLEPPVARRTKLEGAGFYLRGRVGLVAVEPRRIRAVVRSSRPYDVTVLGGETGAALVACDCIAFREAPAVCRHIWATLIKIQNEGIMPQPVATAVP